MPNTPRRLLTITAALLAPLASAHATCGLGKAGTMPLTIQASRLYIPVTMNDTNGVFMVDTGSERSIVDGAYADRAGIGIDRHAGQGTLRGVGDRETIPVNQGHVRSAKIAGIAFHDWEFPIVPAEVGGLGRDEHDGLLGMDFLHFFDLDFDLEAHTLTLWRVVGCSDIHPEWQGDYDAIPLKHTAGQRVTMPIFIDDAFLDVNLDTGADGAIITLDAAHRAGVTDAMLAHDADPQGAGIGGHFAAAVHQFKLLLIGSGQFPNARVAVDLNPKNEGFQDGLVDWRFLHARRFWLSYATSTLFVQKAVKS